MDQIVQCYVKSRQFGAIARQFAVPFELITQTSFILYLFEMLIFARFERLFWKFISIIVTRYFKLFAQFHVDSKLQFNQL